MDQTYDSWDGPPHRATDRHRRHHRHGRHRRGLTFGTIWVLVMPVLPEDADEYTKYTRKVVFGYRIGPPFDSVQLPEKSG